MISLKNRKLSFILAMIFILAVITACGQPGESAAGDTAADTTAAVSTSVLDTLPDVNLY